MSTWYKMSAASLMITYLAAGTIQSPMLAGLILHRVVSGPLVQSPTQLYQVGEPNVSVGRP